jgi:hypothetical protein
MAPAQQDGMVSAIEDGVGLGDGAEEQVQPTAAIGTGLARPVSRIGCREAGRPRRTLPTREPARRLDECRGERLGVSE